MLLAIETPPIIIFYLKIGGYIFKNMAALGFMAAVQIWLFTGALRGGNRPIADYRWIATWLQRM